ncbi:MAG: ARC6/PARC6 family protein [Cyanobacteria bacterium P01_G01_bin.54]
MNKFLSLSATTAVLAVLMFFDNEPSRFADSVQEASTSMEQIVFHNPFRKFEPRAVPSQRILKSEKQTVLPQFFLQSTVFSQNESASEVSIAIADAEQLIDDWQAYKKTLFGPAYDDSRVLDFLDKDGSAYEKNILGTSGKSSSLDWLKENNFYYVYGQQSFRTIKITQTGSYMTVYAAIKEQRIVYENGQPKPKDQHSNPGLSEYRVNYILKCEEGAWRISSYKVV